MRTQTDEQMMRETLKDLGYAKQGTVPELPLERQFTSVHVTMAAWIRHFNRCGLSMQETLDQVRRIYPGISGATVRSVYYYIRRHFAHGDRIDIAAEMAEQRIA